MTIKITEEITKDNYHFLFSAAEAMRKTPDEVIQIDTVNKAHAMRLNIELSNIIDLPDYLECLGSLFLLDCKLLKKLPKNLIVHGSLSVEGTKIKKFPKTLKVSGCIFVDRGNVVKLRKLNPKFAIRINLWRLYNEI